MAEAVESVEACLLHISTDYVFDGNKVGFYREEDDTNPQSVYGETKLSGGLAGQEHCSKYIILRTAWVFGENGNNFIKTTLSLDRECIVSDKFGAPLMLVNSQQQLSSLKTQILIL